MEKTDKEIIDCIIFKEKPMTVAEVLVLLEEKKEHNVHMLSTISGSDLVIRQSYRRDRYNDMFNNGNLDKVPQDIIVPVTLVEDGDNKMIVLGKTA